MKKILFGMIAAATALVCVSCHSSLNERMDALEDRMAALEEKVQLNVDAIARLVAASESAVTINSVEKKDDTYVIHFSDGTTAVLTNGKDGKDGADGKDGQNGADGKDGQNGKDGQTPVIGVKEVDGVLCWTVNGVLLTNNGKPVPVTGQDGVTPSFKVEDGKWFISYDGGSSWNEIGDAVTVVSPAISVEETDAEWIFTIGEQTIAIPKTGGFMIKLVSESAEIIPGETIQISYTLVGADETVHVVAETSHYTAVVNEEACTVDITAPDPLVNGYVIVKAIRNSDGAYSAQYVVITLKDLTYDDHGGWINISQDDRYINW